LLAYSSTLKLHVAGAPKRRWIYTELHGVT
jgi:hypothetical protein